MDNAISATGPEPRIIQYLPGQTFGLVDKSIRYLKSHVLLNQRLFISHQNILDLSRETEATLATYLRDRQKVHLLLIRYPNSPKAKEAFQSFTKAYMPDAAGKDRVKTEDRKWTFARQSDDYILIIFGAPRESDAEALLKVQKKRLFRDADEPRFSGFPKTKIKK